MKNQLTPLKETGIYIVEVRENYYDFSVTNDNRMEYSSDRKASPFSGLTDKETVKIDTSNYIGNLKDLKILGTISKDLISFDPAPYLDKCNVYFSETNGGYRDYTKAIIGTHRRTGEFRQNEYCSTPESSFRSLLTSCGYYWVNPLGSKSLIADDRLIGSVSSGKIIEGLIRLSYEDNLIKGILIALIKDKHNE